METQWLTPDSATWLEILADNAHDFYRLPAYLQLCARQEGGTAEAFLAREGKERFLAPLIFRPILPGMVGRDLQYDVTTPYGYGGPLATTADADFLQRAVVALVDGLRERSAVSAFFRLHPLLPFPVAPLESVGMVAQTGETVAIDLRLPAEELWRQTRSGHRSEINKLRRNGYVAEMAPVAEYLPQFETLYAQTMRRVGASEQYHFSQDYFSDLCAALGERLHLCVVRIEGEVTCAALFTEVDGIVQYHLSGVHDSFVSCHPAKIMLDFARGWAKERGNHLLHLGGGLGGRRDSLFDFKAGFSELRFPFHTWRILVDPPAYALLVSDWRCRTQREPDGPGGFFPAYRKEAAIDHE